MNLWISISAGIIAGIITCAVFHYFVIPWLVRFFALRRLGRVFASYSRKDAEIVKIVGMIVKGLGGELKRDVEFIRGGRTWNEEIEKEIRKSNTFQLFWSHNAKGSTYVAEEWKYALTLRRRNFICPIYWEDDLKPPPELNHIQFIQVHINQAANKADVARLSPSITNIKSLSTTVIVILSIIAGSVMAAAYLVADKVQRHENSPSIAPPVAPRSASSSPPTQPTILPKPQKITQSKLSSFIPLAPSSITDPQSIKINAPLYMNAEWDNEGHVSDMGFVMLLNGIREARDVKLIIELPGFLEVTRQPKNAANAFKKVGMHKWQYTFGSLNAGDSYEASIRVRLLLFPESTIETIINRTITYIDDKGTPQEEVLQPIQLQLGEYLSLFLKDKSKTQVKPLLETVSDDPLPLRINTTYHSRQIDASSDEIEVSIHINHMNADQTNRELSDIVITIQYPDVFEEIEGVVPIGHLRRGASANVALWEIESIPAEDVWYRAEIKVRVPREHKNKLDRFTIIRYSCTDNFGFRYAKQVLP